MSKGRQEKSKNVDTNTNMETDRKTTFKTEAWTIGTLIKTESDIKCSGRVSMSCSACDIRRIAHKLFKVGGKMKPVMESVKWLHKHIYGHL